MDEPRVSQLVLERDGAFGRIYFGTGGEPVNVDSLAEAGARRYGPDGPSGTVGVLMTNDRPTVEVLLGAMSCGATVVSLPLPGRGVEPASYVALLQAACAAHGVAEIVVSDTYAAFAAAAGLRVRAHSQLDGTPLAAPHPAGFRLVQFSSGSTHLPKAVVLDDRAIGANVRAILDRLQPRPGDAVVSWLPLAHDMGLIGMLLASFSAVDAGAGHLVLLDPIDFLRRPSSWIETLSHWRATITASPDFGYRLAALRRPDGDADLSALRCAIVGGEIVRAATMAQFENAYRDHGLDERALCPAYGLAEMGLAVTMTANEERWHVRRVATTALAEGRFNDPEPGEAATDLVASGRPLDGYDVRCAGRSHRTGAVTVRGPSLGTDGATGQRFGRPDGWYDTGDVGFVDDDGLYVCGRTDDYVVAHGCNLYTPAIDDAVGAIDGIRPGRVAAVGLPTGQWAIVAETAESGVVTAAATRQLLAAVRRTTATVAAAQPDEVRLIRRGGLPVTVSGKVQRNEVRARLLRNELEPA